VEEKIDGFQITSQMRQTMSKCNEKAILMSMENNIRKKFSYVSERATAMKVHTPGDIQYVDSKMASDTFNTVFGQPSSADDVKTVVNYYREKSYPAAWWLAPSISTPSVENHLREGGWEFEELDVGMYLPMEKFMPKNTSCELEIKPC
jgi:hypothetical protein